MELTRRNALVYGLLAAVWVLVLVWQGEEHVRVRNAAKTDLRNRSRDTAHALGATVRGLNFRGAVFGDRLQPVLDELVNGRTNELVKSGEVVSVELLNAQGEPVALSGRPIDLQQSEIQQGMERWGPRTVTFVYPIEGAVVPQAGLSNPAAPVLLPPFTNAPPGFRPPPRREMRSAESAADHPPGPRPHEGTQPPPGTNVAESGGSRPGPPPDGEPPRRPFWARRLNQKEYQELVNKRELHGLVLTMSLDTFHAVSRHDLWLRCVITFFASISVVGSGFAWRNLVKSSDLQIRLVRASELNTHLKEMNLAAAGLAHETRNPLNIIRGLAQMVSKRSDTPEEIQAKSREIIEQADRVAAQLNEFINYSRPREVRRSSVALGSVVSEVVRALNYDLEEKKVRLEVKGDQLSIQADEHLLRQALFNLLLNAIQAVNGNGHIQVVAQRQTPSEGTLEIRDNGPGVPPERRSEIFKPYFTTQKSGTGLGLAVVQQIVLVHGWEIQCLPNEPVGALFRITHLKLANARS